MKRYIMLIVFLIYSMSNFSYAGAIADGLYLEYDGGVYKYTSRLVTVVIDGQEVQTGDMPGVIINSRTLVPVREIFESNAFGATVEWNGAKKEVYISYADQFIVLKIDSKVAKVNGKEVMLDVPAKLIRDINKTYPKTMIPLRFVSEALSFEVKWENESYTAVLLSEKATTGTSEEATEGETKEQVDSTKVEGEKLEGLTGSKANKPLPTPLKEQPVQWTASEEALTTMGNSYVETEITNETHPVTKVYDIDYENKGLYKRFIIKAKGPMSGIDYFTWDKKLIIDIEQAICGLDAEETYKDNPVVTGIRSSQFNLEPEATRIVFDLVETGNKFELAYTEDRSQLIVKVMDNSIHDIYLGQNELGDYVKVTGVAAPDAKMFRLSNPDRVVIDFPNTKTVLGYHESVAEGQYIEAIRTAQFDATTTRIVVETDGQADYEITKAAGGETIIQFKEPSYENIEYANVEKPTIILDQAETDIAVESIIYENDYLNRKYAITLDKNYGALFGEGSLKVNDGLIETVEVIQTEEGLTKIVIQSTAVYEYRVEKVASKIEIKAYRPKELYDKIIVVDPGHGGKDPGAVAGGLYEKTLNLKVANYLKNLLEEDGSVQVYYTRLNEAYPTLQDRCDLANEVEADFFLSIHNNAYNSSHTGTETLYSPLEKTGSVTSLDLAGIFQKAVVAITGMKDRGVKKRENLYVLKHTETPAIIVEIGFLTNAHDAALLSEDSFLEKAAKGLYNGIVETFNTYPAKR